MHAHCACRARARARTHARADPPNKSGAPAAAAAKAAPRPPVEQVPGGGAAAPFRVKPVPILAAPEEAARAVMETEEEQEGSPQDLALLANLTTTMAEVPWRAPSVVAADTVPRPQLNRQLENLAVIAGSRSAAAAAGGVATAVDGAPAAVSIPVWFWPACCMAACAGAAMRRFASRQRRRAPTSQFADVAKLV